MHNIDKNNVKMKIFRIHSILQLSYFHIRNQCEGHFH